MLDNMFPFMDNIIMPSAGDLLQCTFDAEAFFSSKEKAVGKPALSQVLTEEDFKQMWILRYQQHLGSISFLEMLGQYEEILGISEPLSNSDSLPLHVVH